MATGFDAYTASANWTEDRDATGTTWTIGSGSITGWSNSVEGLTLNAVDSDADRDDAEVLVKVENLVDMTSISQYTAFVRGTSGGSGPNRYMVRIGGSRLRTYKYVNSTTATQIGTVTTTNFDAAGLYWMRLRVNGTTLQARIWKDGTSEPGTWTTNAADNAGVSSTDTSLSGVGWVGIQAMPSSMGSVAWRNGFGWATNGDTAPASAGGGSTYEVAQAESATAADALSAVSARAAALTESASAADSITTLAAMLASVAEAATAVDAYTSATVALASALEAVTADEALATALVAGAAVAESAALADAATTGPQIEATLTESVSPAEVLAAVQTLAALITDGASATDTMTTAALLAALLTEPATAADSVAGAAPSVHAVSVAETVALLDAMAAALAGEAFARTPKKLAILARSRARERTLALARPARPLGVLKQE